MEGRPPCAGRSKGRGKENHHKRRNETMRKRILSTLLALCLALSLLPASALAAGGEQKSYVALGDSITTGYGLAENETGFAKQVADSNGYTLTNLAQDGATSSMLLTSLSNSEVSSAIASADLITVTIGGNDLMDALYAYLAEEYNKQNSDTPITAEDVKVLLAGEEGAVAEQITMLVFAISNISDFQSSSIANSAYDTLWDNFVEIIETIREINQNAQLIVVNQYNPYSHLTTGISGLDLSSVISAFDSAVQALNVGISLGEAIAGYTVADVYTKFEQAESNPCNASVSPSINLDFHPNATGHGLIADTISALLTDEGGSEDPEVSGSIFVGGVELEGGGDTTAYAVTNNGAVTTDNADENHYNIKWDGQTLTLKGAKITTIDETSDYGLAQSAAIYYDEATDLEIVLVDANTVTGPGTSADFVNSYGIYVDSEVTLTISGSGSLTATGGDATPNSGGESYGIYTWGDAIITSGTVTATGGAAEFQSHGIYATGHVTISGGAVKATGGAVTSSEEDGGDASSGIYANIVTISGGEVTAKGGAVTSSGDNARSCGIYGGDWLNDNVIISGGTVEATGGTFTSTSTDTEANAGSYGIYGAGFYGTVISGGTVTASGGSGALGGDIYLDPEGNASIQSIQVKAGQDADSATEIIGSPFVLPEDITDLVSGAQYFHSESQTLEGNIFVGGIGLTGTTDNPAYAKTGADGAVTTEGANANDYNIKWDGSTLTLNNATITQGALGGAAIWYYRDSDLNIALVGANTVTGPSGSGSGASDGIFARDPNELIDLTISGSGSLTVTGGGTVSESYGIRTDNLIVQSGTGTVNATGGDGAEDSHGIYARHNVTISGGDVTATGGTVNATSEDGAEDSYGIYAANDFTISGGAVTATGGDSEEDSFGIYADNDVTITNGDVTATSGDSADYSCGIYADHGNIDVSGGTVIARGGDSGDNSDGICVSKDGITISGGEVTTTGGDTEGRSCGIDADSITINGGVFTATGGTGTEGSYGIYTGALTITGGTITATGNTSGVYGSSKECKITIAPQTDQQIAVLLGESETAAAAIVGSPFASETEITDQVNNFWKYFHSEVVGITPPEPEEFTITFDAAGGTTPASQTTVDGKLTSLPTSTRDGYDFLGWYTAGGDWVTTDTVFAADTTLYARWAEQAGPGDDDKPPYIPPQPTGPNTGNSEGWDGIQEEIGQAQPGDTITIDMNGETEVPAEMFEEVAGKDVTVELDLGGGITWTVNGQDVPTDTSLSDLDLGVDLGTNGISADVINTVTGAYGTVQMTLAHDGAFGFTLTLTAPLGRENAGYWANLYHYDEEAEALTFETSAQIADDGSVALRMSHASQYAIVIDDKNHGENAGQPTLNTQDHDAYLLGYEDGTVRPEGSITRAEVATIFFRLLTDESRDKFWSQTNDYTDVPADAWYNNAVSTLSNAGILDGYEDGTFRPDGNITRAEFATITARFLEASYDGGNRFPDIDGHWAAEYINEAANAGIVDGYEDGTFRPQQNITRAEAVTMVNRTVDRHPDADHLLDNMITWPDNPESAWYYAQIQEATNAHAYTMHTDQEDAPYEIWTELLPNRDWSALEQAWSDAHAGGENATA